MSSRRGDRPVAPTVRHKQRLSPTRLESSQVDLHIFQTVSQTRFLNSSTVNPASLIIPPMVKASTGFARGMVRILSPLVMVICFLVRTTRKPHFSKALTARWWLIPASLGMSDFYVPYFLFRGQQVHDMNIVLDGFLDILKGFFFGGPLRPAPWEAGHPNGISFIGFLDIYGVSHVTSFLAGCALCEESGLKKQTGFFYEARLLRSMFAVGGRQRQRLQAATATVTSKVRVMGVLKG